ncbi:hypothetical protein AQUCO_00400516v1 [Aquilegia coerulea]|uniref:DNA-directed RNA polymerase I subunit rpa49 n=1 Tax=Aquilegia coerulea TaxID=218851 RepID=A0A2G5EVC2_AQUCA|nr:hypothetical protein AQUCO_00400516v1 [Aquilegia coerulea]
MAEEEENQITADEEELYRKLKEKKKLKKKNKIKLEEQQQQEMEMELEEKTQLIEESNEKRKKKKKKNKIIPEEEQHQHQQQEEMDLDEKTELIEEIDEKEKRKKKKKKDKIKLEEEEEMDLDEKTEIIEEINEKEKRKMNKKKKREDTIDEQEEIILREEVIVEEVNARFEVIGEQQGKIAPIVCYYSSGFNPQMKNKNSEDDDGIEIKTFRKKSRVEVVVTPKDYKLDFVGESHSGEPAASQVCCYSLAVFDKESQTLKIVPIAANKILRLEPKFRTPNVYDKEPVKGLNEEDQTPVKKLDATRSLLKSYGTKYANKNALRLDILNRREDAETQKTIDEKTQHVKLNEKALATASGAPSRNIPPHDSTAVTPEKAYPIDRIIFPGEWNSLLDVLELVQSKADIAPSTYPIFVCNRIHKLREIQDEEERKKLACIFSYITHLIKFKDQRSVDRNSSTKNHRIPSILNTKFLSMFADNGNYNPSPEKINLLISYVLVLTLIADGYRTTVVDIAKDLKMPPQKVKDHYSSLGCKIKRESNSMVYTLPTPLEFPQPRMKRRRK